MKQLSHKRKKLLIGFVSSLLLIATIIGVTIGVTSSRGNTRLPPTTHEVVKGSCSSTLYPDLCYSTIASAPPHTLKKITTHKDVIAVSLNLTTRAVEHNYILVESLIKTRKSLTIREKNALHDCLETIDSTLDELRTTLQDLQTYHHNNNPNKQKHKSIEEYADDMKTLISAAITNQVTCLDGFSHDNADRLVRKALQYGQVHVEQLCSNALAMITNMTNADVAATRAKTLNTKRQLYDHHIDDGWPRWMSSGDKRMLQEGPPKADAVVAADGSGDHRTVAEAVAAAPTKSKTRYVIMIKAGVYKENVEVDKKKTNIMFVGEGRGKTIITGSKNVVDGSTTYDSATVAIKGEGFLARDLTIENTAGPSKHQAVALRVGADFSAFYQCDILAYQDTLYVHNSRQFFVKCLITGTVDFIFGNAAVVFQDCDIHARKPNPQQKNMITAQSRTDPNQNTGIVIQKCRIKATSDLQAVASSFPTYLGRPWKEYSRTIIMQSSISNVVHPAGWHEWDGEFGIKTLYYAEYENTGPGAETSNRVKWKGVNTITDATEAKQFTPREFIAGESWLGSTTFPFSLGL